jgi:hypothetical protein
MAEVTTVFVLFRNNHPEADGRRVCLGVFRTEDGARRALVDDMDELDGVYAADDYETLPQPLED